MWEEVCGVCLSSLVDPVVLECGDSLCYSCVSDLIDRQALRIRQSCLLWCPRCRKPTYVPQRSAKGLKMNVLWKEEQATYITEAQKCSGCEDSANSVCLACDIHLCSRCVDTHASHPSFRGHKVIKSSSQLLFCMTHKKPLELYCLNEFAFLCIDCAESSAHPRHEILTILQARLALRQEMCSYRTYCEETISKLSDIRFLHSEAKRRLDPQYSSAFDQKIAVAVAFIENLTEIARERDGLSFLSKIGDATHIDFNALRVTDLPSEALQEVGDVLAESLPTDPIYMLYIERGNNRFCRYNAITQASENSLNSDREFPRWSMLTPISNTEVTITGGKPNKDSGAMRIAFLFDYMRNITDSLPNMIEGHSSHVAVLIDEELYVCGGKNSHNTTHRSCEKLKLKTKEWESIESMAVDRTCATGFRHSSSLYVLGGYRNDVEQSIEQYSIPANTWTLLPATLPENLWQHNSWLISRDQVLIFGGEKLGDESHRFSYIWDIPSQRFQKYAEVPVSSTWLVSWLHIVRRGNYLYALGKDFQVLKYSISRNKWSVELC